MAKLKDQEAKEDPKATSKEFLHTRTIGEKIDYSKRKTILMEETCMRLKAGKEYDIFHEKADYLITKGVATEVRK